jgi:hypothetical protein
MVFQETKSPMVPTTVPLRQSEMECFRSAVDVDDDDRIVSSLAFEFRREIRAWPDVREIRDKNDRKTS